MLRDADETVHLLSTFKLLLTAAEQLVMDYWLCTHLSLKISVTYSPIQVA